MRFPPNVVHNDGYGNKVNFDIYSALLQDRIIMFTGEVDDDLCNSTMAQLLFLEKQNPEKDIYMHINSPGGNVSDGMAVYDTMQYIKPDVITICTGIAMSMGAVILSGGKQRMALPHSEIMIHQPLSAYPYSQATDLDIRHREMLKCKDMLTKLLAKNTGQPLNKIAADMERDYHMNPKEALEYGIIDKIIK